MPKIMEQKILTLNLDNKKGVNILLSRYNEVKDSILKIMKKQESITLTELSLQVQNELESKFDGKIGWYFMAVKLDLEARGFIFKVPKISPQTLTLTNKI